MEQLRLRVLLTLTLVIALGAGGVALAQDETPEPEAPPPAAQEEQPEGIEEITVTARRREENLQRTPVSIAAFTAAELEERSSTSLDDLGKMTANLTFTKGSAANRNTAQVFMRGVGQADNSLTYDPGVAIYIDGVYLARMQGSVLDLVDIERVEVLRGPQGTLFGKNTIGGAVSIVTSKPTGEFGGKARVRFGNYGRLDSNLKLDFPLREGTLAGRVAFATSTSDGYSKNLVTGSRWDADKMLGARLSLLWTPSETAEIWITADRMQQNQGNGGGSCVVLDPNNRSFATTTFPRPVYFGRPWSLFGFNSDPAGGSGLTGAEECQRSQEASKDYDFFADGRNRSDMDTWSTTATAEFQLGDKTLKSISSWRRMEWSRAFEFDYTPLIVGSNEQRPNNQQNQWSQEVQLLGTALEDRLSWITGIYWFNEKSDFNSVNAIALFPNANSGNRRGIEALSYAAFGQFTYQLTDKLSLTAGARRTHERKYFSNAFLTRRPFKLNPGPEDLMLRPDISVMDDSQRFNSWTPMGNLSLQLTDDLLLYTTWSRGFISGGLNFRPPAANPGLVPYDPATLSSWEVGVKSTWLDNRLRVNFAAFNNDYEDMQISVFRANAAGDFVNLFQNAGEATIRGFELEMVAVPLPGLQLSAGLGITDAEYDEFLDLDPITGITSDRSHLDLHRSPKRSLNASISYEFPAMEYGTLTLRTDYYMQSKVYLHVDNDEGLSQDQYGVLNARANFALSDGNTEIAAYVTNATERFYNRAAVALKQFLGVGYTAWGEPRMYGVELVRRF